MKAYPKHVFDYILRPLIVIFWEPWSLKRSHWWHWRKFIYPYVATEFFPIKINGYKKAKSRQGFWANLVQTNFGWKMTAIIEPIDYCGEYQVGYWETDKDGKKYPQTCALILKGKTAVLRGPEDVEFYGFSYPEHRPLKLRMVDQKPKNELKNINLI